MQFHIQGATPVSGKSLCLTCKGASVVRGQNCEEQIICQVNMFPNTKGLVIFKVAECGSFHPKNHPWYHEMVEIAWKVEPRKRGDVGFQSASGEMEVVIERPGRRDMNGGPRPIGG